MSHDDRDSSDDENVDEVNKRKITAKARLTKYIGAKASSSKMGRDLIKKACGEDGTALLDIFENVMKDFSTKHEDKKMDHTQMQKYLFKIVVKCGVFLDNGILTEDQFTDVSLEAAAFSWMLVDMCELPMVVNDFDKLQRMLDKINSGISDLLKPLVKGKSLERLAVLRKNLSADLFKFLMQDEAAAENRGKVASRLLSFLESRKIPRPATEMPETDKK